jgi:hypothetical protein
MADIHVTLVDRDMLTRVWNEMDYRIDVCHITKGGHIEYLYFSVMTFDIRCVVYLLRIL